MFNFELVAGDTDGIAFKKKDQTVFTDAEQADILERLNRQMDELIRWENDGQFKMQIVVKAKYYVLVDGSGKTKIKGSALKATTKEKALKRFVGEVLDLLIQGKRDQIFSLYMRYAGHTTRLVNIEDWCSKKTITKAVLTNTRTNEKRVREALKGRPVQEGDKVFMFFKTPEELCLREDFSGQYDVDILLGKLYDTLCIFETIIDVSLFPNLSLKRNRALLPAIS